MRDSLGDRMKEYERAHVSRALPGIPVCVRLDGKAFHNWTHGLCRPWDNTFHQLMDRTTAFLVEQSNAKIGYTQSDEITLIYYSDSPESQIFFDGKIQKMTSVLSSMCTAKFNEQARLFPDTTHKALAFFDCRIWQVPNLREAISVLIWREADCRRNSIMMTAQEHYSHKQLLKKSVKEQLEMLHQKGVNWSKESPDRFKRGAYFARRTGQRLMADSEWKRIPEAHRPPWPPFVERKVIKNLQLGPMRRIVNSIEVVFNGAEPVYGSCNQHPQS